MNAPVHMVAQAPAAAFTLQDASTIIQLLQNGSFGFNLRQSQDLQGLIERFANYCRTSGLQPTLPQGQTGQAGAAPPPATPPAAPPAAED
jgi:hypothetical protein